MDCQYCKNQPEYICSCFSMFCHSDIITHRGICQNFTIKMIDDPTKVKMLSAKLSLRVQKIHHICGEIIKKTQKLLAKIEELCKNSIEKLKEAANRYQSIIEKGYLDELEAELKAKMEEKKIEDLDMKLIEFYYEQEFFGEEESENFKNWGPSAHAQFCGHTDSVWSCAMTSDNKTLFSGSTDTTIKIWKAENSKMIGELLGHSGIVEALEIIQDDQKLISGCSDSIINIWDWKARKIIGKLKGHTGKINVFSISICEKYLLSGSGDKTAKLWDIEKKKFNEKF